MTPEIPTFANRRSPWPHRLAWLLACGTFPLIWVGGLVTTYGAGMAVPDWPNTYGYNLFLYPLASWLHVWDVFLEHSHRLIGATVGMITIALAAALWIRDPRRWMRWLGLVALAGVVFQGTLGGLRVIRNAILLALVHGCTAPVFFGLCAALVVFTSPRWLETTEAIPTRPMRRFQALALLTTGAIYVQIVLGANLRHRPAGAATVWFEIWVWLHLIVASLVLGAVFWLWSQARRHLGEEPRLARRARLLAILFAIQISLGLATWVTKYGFPGWFADYLWAVHYTVVAGGRLQGTVVTAHVGVGSLCLATSLSLALWSLRFYRTTSEISQEAR